MTSDEMSEASARYSRQVRLTELGSQGQEKLAQSSVVIIGCGALGAMAASVLARSGVGRIKLIDRDIV